MVEGAWLGGQPHRGAVDYKCTTLPEDDCGGKRGILCEKPLATTVAEAQLIADASARTGVPVVVGAMHVYDPAFAAAQKS